jgi:hypothetical protein
MPRLITFVQFMKPAGRQREQYIELPDEIADRAEKILARGMRFEMELLSDDITVSFTISDDRGDYSHRFCANGPAVPATVEALIMEFPL